MLLSIIKAERAATGGRAGAGRLRHLRRASRGGTFGYLRKHKSAGVLFPPARSKLDKQQWQWGDDSGAARQTSGVH